MPPKRAPLYRSAAKPLRKQKRKMTIEEFKALYKELKHKKRDLESEKRDLERENRRLGNEKIALHKHERDHMRLKATLGSAKVKLDACRDELIRSNNEKTSQMRKNARLEKEVSDLTEERDAIKDFSERAKKYMSQLRGEKKWTGERIAKLEKDRKMLALDRTFLLKSNARAKDLYEELERQCKELKQKVIRLQRQVEALKQGRRSPQKSPPGESPLASIQLRL